MMGNGMEFGMGFGGLWMLLLLILAVVLIVWLVRSAGSRHTSASQSQSAERESAVEVAERRYASGEISQEALPEMGSLNRESPGATSSM